jgi:predicted DNA-binding transcriptional regulator YafY
MANPFANTVKFLNAVSLLASPQGATIKGLMDALNLSRRSVFRLLDALKELGFPLVDYQPQAKAEKAYRLLESYVLKLPNISMLNPCFTEDETELILSILDLCKRISGLGGASMLDAVREKIKAITPDEEGRNVHNRHGGTE